MLFSRASVLANSLKEGKLRITKNNREDSRYTFLIASPGPDFAIRGGAAGGEIVGDSISEKLAQLRDLPRLLCYDLA